MVKEKTKVETTLVTDVGTMVAPAWITEKSGISLPMRCRYGPEVVPIEVKSPTSRTSYRCPEWRGIHEAFNQGGCQGEKGGGTRGIEFTRRGKEC
jgi:hypothetical protein